MAAKINPMTPEQAAESVEQILPGLMALVQRSQAVLNEAKIRGAARTLRQEDMATVVLAQDILTLGAGMVHSIRECAFLRKECEDLRFELTALKVQALPEKQWERDKERQAEIRKANEAGNHGS